MEKDEKKKGAMLDEAFLQNLMQNEQVEQILEEGEAFQTLMAYYRYSTATSLLTADSRWHSSAGKSAGRWNFLLRMCLNL